MLYKKPLSLVSAVTVWAAIVIAVAAPKNGADILSKSWLEVTQSWVLLERLWSAMPSYALHAMLIYAAGVCTPLLLVALQSFMAKWRAARIQRVVGTYFEATQAGEVRGNQVLTEGQARRLRRRSSMGPLVNLAWGTEASCGPSRRVSATGSTDHSPSRQRSLSGAATYFKPSTGAGPSSGVNPIPNAAMPVSMLEFETRVPYSQTPESRGAICVLSADGSAINQAVVSLLLGYDQRFKCLQAFSGAEVLQMVDTLPYLPDVILLDVLLPDMPGGEVVAELRVQYTPVHLPIIVIGARNGDDELLQCLEAGANDFYIKPLRRLELISRVNSQLAVQRHVQAEAENRCHYELLSAVLPPHIISRLRSGSQCIAEKHGEVTILFSDIVSFTEICAEWPTEHVVQVLDALFSRFDDLCDKHGVFKVETIGDAYMAVCGHEDNQEQHTLRIMEMAVDMMAACADLQGFVAALQEQQQGLRDCERGLGDEQQQERQVKRRELQVRIGMHTGPVYSGVVGIKRPRYCFFGDTVNTASRMESTGAPMCIHMSSNTHAAMLAAVERAGLGGCSWEIEDCGISQVKGKGLMHTFLYRFPMAPQTPNVQAAPFPPALEGTWSSNSGSGCSYTPGPTLGSRNSLLELHSKNSSPLPKLGLLRTKTIDYANWQPASPQQRQQQQQSIALCAGPTGQFLNGWAGLGRATSVAGPLSMGRRPSMRLEPAREHE